MDRLKNSAVSSRASITHQAALKSARIASVVRVERPSPQFVTILGIEIRTESPVALRAGPIAALLDRFFPRKEYREAIDFVVEILREDGSSIGGSHFELRCEGPYCESPHSSYGNYLCSTSNFRSHIAMATRDGGLGVSAPYRRQDLATKMYRLATSYAVAEGWYIVPAAHVKDEGL